MSNKSSYDLERSLFRHLQLFFHILFLHIIFLYMLFLRKYNIFPIVITPPGAGIFSGHIDGTK